MDQDGVEQSAPFLHSICIYYKEKYAEKLPMGLIICI